MAAKRVAIIGAGASGLTAIKACKEEYLEVVCFEQTSGPGGRWRYRECQNTASVASCTVTLTSKDLLAFSDFPPPAEFPNFLPHQEVLRYLDLYVEQFGLLDHVRFCHQVVEVNQCDDFPLSGRWLVSYIEPHSGDTRQEVFDGVVICTGRRSHPHFPFFQGLQDLFEGRVLHAADYRTSSDMLGRRVLVVGLGNSGAEVAVDVSHVAEKVYLSTRRGCWLLGRLIPGGLPTDADTLCRWKNLLAKMLPFNLQCHLWERRATHFVDHQLFGLRPRHRFLSDRPVTNDDLVSRLMSGKIILRGDVSAFTSTGAIFEDDPGKEEQIDQVILATGYHFRLPFIDPESLDIDEFAPELYKFVFPARLSRPTLAFIGLAESSGPDWPTAEMQARWVARILAGKGRLPSQEAMMKDIQDTTENLQAQFSGAGRYCTRVEHITYLDQLAEIVGCKPDLKKILLSDFSLFKACFVGPCLPYQYRLCGPHSWSVARETILKYPGRLRAPLCLHPNDLPSGHTGAMVTACFLVACLLPVMVSWSR